jgi:hypothetical protein
MNAATAKNIQLRREKIAADAAAAGLTLADLIECSTDADRIERIIRERVLRAIEKKDADEFRALCESDPAAAARLVDHADLRASTRRLKSLDSTRTIAWLRRLPEAEVDRVLALPNLYGPAERASVLSLLPADDELPRYVRLTPGKIEATLPSVDLTDHQADELESLGLEVREAKYSWMGYGAGHQASQRAWPGMSITSAHPRAMREEAVDMLRRISPEIRGMIARGDVLAEVLPPRSARMLLQAAIQQASSPRAP